MLQVIGQFLDFGTNGTVQLFTVTNVGGGTLSCTCASLVSWASVSQVVGSGDATVAVFVTREGLPPGDSNGSISVTSNGGSAIVTVRASEPLAGL